MKRILTLLLCALLLLPSPAVHAADIADGVLSAQLQKNGVADKQAFVDLLAETPDGGREWYVLALAAEEPELDFSGYASALVQYLSDRTVSNAVTRQKYALALLACGYHADFVETTRNDSFGKLGIMSYIFALHLANNGKAPDDMTADGIVTALLAMKKPDGGFALSGERSEADVTAMALQALAPHRSRADVAQAIEASLTALKNLQTENGGFLAYGKENAESAAQVLLALTTLGIEPSDGDAPIKNGKTVLDSLLSYRTESGAFSHTADGSDDESATMQAYFALSAWENERNPYLFRHDALTELTTPAADADRESARSYRPVALLAILVAALLVCLVLLLMKKKNPKSYLAVGAVALLAALAVLFTEVQSTDGYYGSSEVKRDPIGTVTLSIRCDALVGQKTVPEDGVILAPTQFAIEKGDTVYDILVEATRLHRIHMETKGSGELAYIEGIAHLYEMQFGELSGWIYSVNGVSASVGCASHTLTDGDVIAWTYTLDLGEMEASP